MLEEIKKNLEEELFLISSFYTQAWKAIKNKNYKLVIDILHKKMPVKLYDRSLTILDDRNINRKYSAEQEELAHLIEKVDRELENYYNTHKDEELVDDKEYLNNSIIKVFTKRKYKK